jgi:hypothetical protein
MCCVLDYRLRLALLHSGEDIGQMNFYMGYFAEEENAPDDNPPIGIVLTREDNQMLVKYATYGSTSQTSINSIPPQ